MSPSKKNQTTISKDDLTALNEIVKGPLKLVHASNLLNKIKRCKNGKVKSTLVEIQRRYISYYKVCQNCQVQGRNEIETIVNELNDYYDFVKSKVEKNKNKFSSQSKLLSSILEEFLVFLFKYKVAEFGKNRKNICSGSTEAYTNLFIIPDSEDTPDEYDVGIHKKQQDYAIYRSFTSEEIFTTEAISKTRKTKKGLNVPIVAIECKTYIDKVMLDSAIALADKTKTGNPQSLFLVVAEEYDIADSIDPSYSRIDQIYILRKSKRIRGGG